MTAVEVLLGLFIGVLLYFYFVARPNILKSRKRREWHENNVEQALEAILYKDYFKDQRNRVAVKRPDGIRPGAPFLSEAWVRSVEVDQAIELSILMRVSDDDFDFHMDSGSSITRDSVPISLSNAHFGFMLAVLNIDKRTASEMIFLDCAFKDEKGTKTFGELIMEVNSQEYTYRQINRLTL